MANTLIDKIELMIDDLVFDSKISSKGVLFSPKHLEEIIGVLIDAREEIEKLQSAQK